MGKYKDKYNHSKQSSFHTGKPQEVDKSVQLIALDSNVFIDMSHEMAGKRRDVAEVTENFYDRLAAIRKLAENGKVKFVIPPTVLQEITVSGLNKSECDFIQKYCLIMQPKGKKETAEKISKLTMEYVRSGIMPRGKKHPYGDAMIMAQATVGGLNLLTNNYRDFEVYDTELNFYKKDKLGDFIPKKKYNDSMLPKNTRNLNENQLEYYLKTKGRYRAVEIGHLNRGWGYSYKNKNGYTVTPMPFTTIDFIGKEKNEEGLWLSNQFTTNFNSEEFDLVPYEQDR